MIRVPKVREMLMFCKGALQNIVEDVYEGHGTAAACYHQAWTGREQGAVFIYKN